MSRRGNCWDHAVAESFFSSVKKERIKKRIYKTREMANAEIYDDIAMLYHRTRDTAISAVSVRRRLKPCRYGRNGVRKRLGSPQRPRLFSPHT